MTDEGKIFLINERSKGCKWFFSFLLFTEFRKNRTKNILFLLDEPASNLHASAQEKIVQAIQDLSTQAMVIYSTHSAHLINPEWLAGAYVVVNDVLSEDALKGALTLNTSVEITVKKYFYYIGSGEGSDKLSFFQPILDALEYRPSQLDLVPEIVIVEGKYDWNGYTYFNEVILNTGKNYNFYPGGGKEKLFDIIRLYLAWGRKFLVLLDGDAEKSKKKYISEFGEFVANRIYTLKDVFGEKYCLENLIEECDKNTLYNSVFPETPYEELPNSKKKSNLNIAINKLLWEKKKVKISKTTKDRFSTLFDFIGNHL